MKMNPEGTWYLLGPTPTELVTGMVVVHNVGWTGQRLGENGFRAWQEQPGRDRRVPCSCGWAPELGAHYRTDRR